ncbi:MAG: hypothetical protein M3Y72_08935 [Acidobacteriota bacterium]|nr:hypothetical protein [Acidobacteriota bacterium]
MRSSAAIGLLLITVLPTQAGQWQETHLEPACVANTPEHRGEIGCSLVEDKPPTNRLTEPLYWHIDSFKNKERAQAAVDWSSVAFEAHGRWWLLHIESATTDHHGGLHVAQVLLTPLPPDAKYSLLTISAYIPQGMTSRVHHHSGVEAFYTVDGQQCLETEARAMTCLKAKF